MNGPLNYPRTYDETELQRAITNALLSVDEFVIEAPRACSAAIADLVGNSWGSGQLDQSPLMRVYIDSIWHLSELGAPDPAQLLKELLDGCVARAKQVEHPAFVLQVSHINPVEFLAGLLEASVGVATNQYCEAICHLKRPMQRPLRS